MDYKVAIEMLIIPNYPITKLPTKAGREIYRHVCSSLSVWNTSASASRRGKASLFWRNSVSHTLIVELSLSSIFVEIFTITFHTVCFDMSSLTLKTATFSSDPKTRKIVQRKYKSAMVKEFSYFEFFFWPG